MPAKLRHLLDNDDHMFNGGARPYRLAGRSRRNLGAVRRVIPRRGQPTPATSACRAQLIIEIAAQGWSRNAGNLARLTLAYTAERKNLYVAVGPV